MGHRQNLWDKAIEAKKEQPIHPLLRARGVTAGLGTLAERTGQEWRAALPFRHQGGGWGGSSGSGGGGWWAEGR